MRSEDAAATSASPRGRLGVAQPRRSRSPRRPWPRPGSATTRAALSAGAAPRRPNRPGRGPPAPTWEIKSRRVRRRPRHRTRNDACTTTWQFPHGADWAWSRPNPSGACCCRPQSSFVRSELLFLFRRQIIETREGPFGSAGENDPPVSLGRRPASAGFVLDHRRVDPQPDAALLRRRQQVLEQQTFMFTIFRSLSADPDRDLEVVHALVTSSSEKGGSTPLMRSRGSPRSRRRALPRPRALSFKGHETKISPRVCQAGRSGCRATCCCPVARVSVRVGRRLPRRPAWVPGLWDGLENGGAGTVAAGVGARDAGMP